MSSALVTVEFLVEEGPIKGKINENHSYYNTQIYLLNFFQNTTTLRA